MADTLFGNADALSGWRAGAVRVLGTCLGTGYAPFASGTFGTLPAVGAFLLIMGYAPASSQTPLLAALLALACAGAVVLGNWSQRVWNQKDPGRFVLDEFAGFLLVGLLFLLFRPGQLRGHLLPLTLWAFAAARFFDIAKPPPCRRLEKLPGGWGILLDDLCASLYAAGLLHALYALWPSLFNW